MANDLKITEENLQRIWTTFENSILHNTDLMKDRHLDQLLMCSIYIFARVCNLPIQFKDIMTVYRLQPQAQSHIYRRVLGNDGNRCDIIDFYNRIYVVAVQEFALRWRPTSTEDVSLSPLPINLRCLPSPRKVSKNHSIYVQELRSNEILQSPKYTEYTLNASPVQVNSLETITCKSLNSSVWIFPLFSRTFLNSKRDSSARLWIRMANVSYRLPDSRNNRSKKNASSLNVHQPYRIRTRNFAAWWLIAKKNPTNDSFIACLTN